MCCKVLVEIMVGEHCLGERATNEVVLMAKVMFVFCQVYAQFCRKCDILFLYVWPFEGSHVDV